MVRNFSEEPRKKETKDDETWMWRMKMNIGTWKVRSLFWSVALKGLHNQLSKLDFDIVSNISGYAIGKWYTKI